MAGDGTVTATLVPRGDADGAEDLLRMGQAAIAGALLAVDPRGLGGAILLRPTHDAARRWCSRLHEAMGARISRRLPINATEDRVLGGMDLAATLARGERVVMRGVLAESDQGIVVAPLAERLLPSTTSALCDALDCGEVRLERDGIAARHAARIALIALDETAEDPGDVQVASSLMDRLAFVLQLPVGEDDSWWPGASDVVEARALLPRIDGTTAARDLSRLADALGVVSLRAVLQAVRCARACAALDGRRVVTADDVTVAARLVLAPRATRIPPSPEPPPEVPPDDPNTSPADHDDGPSSNNPKRALPDEVMLEAIRAFLPPDLLASAEDTRGRRARSAGRRGRESNGGARGRQLRAEAGRPSAGRTLDPVATLRVAAPWQRVRRAEHVRAGRPESNTLDVRGDDLRIRRFKQQSGTTTIIAVDASGSMAMQRLAEAKGAVELLLAQTYVRRDKVALVAFRGAEATLLLPPTRALARAKRLVAALPGGGGTPLASAIDVVHGVAIGALREGQEVIALWLTDGRANIARDGTPGRARATDDAMRAARAFRALDVAAVFIDTSPRGEGAARELSRELGGRYIPLPSAQAQDVARCITQSRRGVEG